VEQQQQPAADAEMKPRLVVAIKLAGINLVAGCQEKGPKCVQPSWP